MMMRTHTHTHRRFHLMCVAGRDSNCLERKSSLCLSWCFCFSGKSTISGFSISSSSSPVGQRSKYNHSASSTCALMAELWLQVCESQQAQCFLCCARSHIFPFFFFFKPHAGITISKRSSLEIAVTDIAVAPYFDISQPHWAEQESHINQWESVEKCLSTLISSPRTLHIRLTDKIYFASGIIHFCTSQVIQIKLYLYFWSLEMFRN